jgi:hypothetical protein
MDSAMPLTREQVLVALFPVIPWCEPVPVQTPDGAGGYACRFCIALNGIKGADVAALPKTTDWFASHLRTVHGFTTDSHAAGTGGSACPPRRTS